LRKQGAIFSDENEVSFKDSLIFDEDRKKTSYLVPLTHLGVILLEGEDAKKFLQGQVTCDINKLSGKNSISGARCNPKGRTLTNFQLHQINDEKLLMVMHHSLITKSKDELAKYAAFFRVKLFDASDEYALFGFDPIDSKNQHQEQHISSSYSYEDGRFVASCPIGYAEEVWSNFIKKMTPTGTDLWKKSDIQSGIPTLQEETSDIFVPQMLNLDHLDSISFTKGCYTGQEVVARMKYLGKLKKKMYRIHRKNNILPLPGTPCYIEETRQVSGNIISAVQINIDFQELLVVLTDKAAKNKDIAIGDGSIEKIKYLPISYIK